MWLVARSPTFLSLVVALVVVSAAFWVLERWRPALPDNAARARDTRTNLIYVVSFFSTRRCSTCADRAAMKSACSSLQLAGDLPDLVVFDCVNRSIDRRHREETIEERQLLPAVRNPRKFARHDEVLGSAMSQAFARGDPDNERRLLDREPAALRDDLRHQA